jgi:voltage-gated potassium channel
LYNVDKASRGIGDALTRAIEQPKREAKKQDVMGKSIETKNVFSIIKQSLILILSLYVVIELAIEVIIPFPENIQKILDNIDFAICMVFILDFSIGLFTSPGKAKYLKSHWFDLISSIPFSSIFRLLRIIRIVRIVRLAKLAKLLRGIKAIRPIVIALTKNKLRSILVSYIIALTFVLFYCSLGFYMCEKETNDMVKTYGDAIWWGFITVTSVGYGDVFPKSTEGRLFGMALALCGMGLFSLVTAELSSKFLKYLNTQSKQECDEKKSPEE